VTPLPAPLPRHIAVIMDGNRRWARKRSLPGYAGHRKGAEVARAFVRSCIAFGVPYVTLYAFSTENNARPPDEVDSLMQLLRRYLTSERVSLEKEGVAMRLLGDASYFPEDIRRLIADAEKSAPEPVRLRLNVALGYGSKQEIANACAALCREAAEGKLAPADVLPETLERRLYTAGCPDPDLLIRTGGEKRLSNFLLWQSAYAELYFSDVLWPDFDEAALLEALRDYAGRERRYGGM
jgi:undecaprenyl diphosphate synthase